MDNKRARSAYEGMEIDLLATSTEQGNRHV